jgi:hypothetical protein
MYVMGIIAPANFQPCVSKGPTNSRDPAMRDPPIRTPEPLTLNDDNVDELRSNGYIACLGLVDPGGRKRRAHVEVSVADVQCDVGLIGHVIELLPDRA